MTPEEEIARGHQAARLLNDPLVDEAFTSLKVKLEDVRNKTKWNERDLREHIHMQLIMLRDLREYFDAMVRTGNVTMKKASQERAKK